MAEPYLEEVSSTSMMWLQLDETQQATQLMIAEVLL